jgi:hypothetical protein
MIGEKYKTWKEGKKTFLEVQGVDYGTIPEVLKESEKALLIKVNGYTGWIARGNSGYIKPSFEILLKLPNEKIDITGTTFNYNRENKKEELEKAINLFNRINGKVD